VTSDKYIVLDRDGVINEDLWGYVTTPEQFKFIDKSLEAIKLLNDCGFKITIATNQAV
jgi:Histidinol phosphatase and related phosphatases